jgi:hypothetical protein
MTEADWLAAVDPTPMVASIRGRASAHQMAIASVALCRADRELMSHPISREVVEWVERVINGEVRFDDAGGPDDGDCYLMAAAANRCLGVASAATRGRPEEAHQHLTEMIEFLIDDADAATLQQMAAVCRRLFAKPFGPETPESNRGE